MTPELKHSKLFKSLKSLIFYFSILFFIIGFNFTDSPPPFGWYQQFMPNLGGRQIQDITFLDSLTGYACARQTSDSSYILKTTNGGDDWQIIYRNFFAMTQIQFLNLNIGYACGAYLYKTTDGGFNWNQVSAPPISPEGLYVIDQNTIWIISSNSLTVGVFHTTNGGVSWITQYSQGSANPSHIYMFNAMFGFMDGGGLKRTTDGGSNWTPIPGEGLFFDMYFIDNLTGWKCDGYMKKTTDGGLTWVNQNLPYGGIISSFSQMIHFSNVNRDTIWGGGGYLNYGGGRERGIIYKTINGGANWRFQLPDTSFGIPLFSFVKFKDKLRGWGYESYFSQQVNAIITTGVHTLTGGDSVWYMGMVQKSNEVPKNFILKQNYPNPFNPRTVIPYSLKSPAYVRLIAYDITGREVQKLVDQKQTAGEFEVDFMGKFVSSGVYLYRMQATDEKGNTSFSDTKKMILLK